MQTCDPLEHPAAHVRRNNIVRLARLGGGDTQLQQLARVARGDADAGCRAAAVAAMVAISPKGDRCPHAVIAVVNECLRDPDAAVRNAAARALGLDRSRAGVCLCASLHLSDFVHVPLLTRALVHAAQTMPVQGSAREAPTLGGEFLRRMRRLVTRRAVTQRTAVSGTATSSTRGRSKTLTWTGPHRWLKIVRVSPAVESTCPPASGYTYVNCILTLPSSPRPIHAGGFVHHRRPWSESKAIERTSRVTTRRHGPGTSPLSKYWIESTRCRW